MLDEVAPNLKTGVCMLSETVDANARESDIGSQLGEIAKANPEAAIGSYPFFDAQYGAKTNVVLRARDGKGQTRGREHAGASAASTGRKQGFESPMECHAGPIPARRRVLPPETPPPGQQLFASHCGICHATQPGVNRIGPSLAGDSAARAEPKPGYDYSAALKAAAITWDEKELDKFLQNPSADVHGTKMVVSVPGNDDRQNIIALSQDAEALNVPRRRSRRILGRERQK